MQQVRNILYWIGDRTKPIDLRRQHRSLELRSATGLKICIKICTVEKVTCKVIQAMSLSIPACQAVLWRVQETRGMGHSGQSAATQLDRAQGALMGVMVADAAGASLEVPLLTDTLHAISLGDWLTPITGGIDHAISTRTMPEPPASLASCGLLRT